MPNSLLTVTSPCDGAVIETLAQDSTQSLADKIFRAATTQKKWAMLPRATRVLLIEKLSAGITASRQSLIDIVVKDAGKSAKEAAGEVDGSADILLKSIKDSTLPELGGMARVKERVPAGVVGLITSFNFPLAVANWSIGPALLAGNAVVWKPSEKTPLVALAYKEIFDEVFTDEYKNLLELIIGGRQVGEALVASEQVDMISATGSVAMGLGIKSTLAKKTNNHVAPILELGGNNGVIISDKSSPAHLEFAVNSILNSYLASAGQRCTNTRRLIVQVSVLEKVISLLEQKISAFIQSGVVVNPTSGTSNDYGYGPLIDTDAKNRFDAAKKDAIKQGGKIIGGDALPIKGGVYIAPALAIMASQTAIMHSETFAPLLFIAPYTLFEEAIALLNAPENAGLVGGIYTQSKSEAEAFALLCAAGHCLINSPKGTGTPAFGMGFGGNKHSGEGEILNAADPLQAFTRPGSFRRIATNVAINMDAD